MDDSSSGFFSRIDGYGQPDLSTFTPIPNSEGALCSLFRGERAGKFRVYKCLKPQYRGDALYEGLLKKEFESGYSLRHGNICEFYSYLEIEGLGNCIEMEWIDGISLDSWLKENRCSEAGRGPLPENRRTSETHGHDLGRAAPGQQAEGC